MNTRHNRRKSISGGGYLSLSVTLKQLFWAVGPVGLAAMVFQASGQQSTFTYDASGSTIGTTSTVGSSPVIEAQPQPGLFQTNGLVSFSVTANGEGLSYQWLSNGVAIAGATTDTLLLSNQPATASGSFSVVISNMSGISVTSTPVGLNLDSRGVGMPDWWQMQYFGNLNQFPGSDYDGDGVNNLDEYLEGTNPTNAASYDPRLYLQYAHGLIAASPAQHYYTMGQAVTLTAIPDPGQDFLGWSGSITGTNPVATITMGSNQYITASFGIPLPIALNNTNLIWTTGGAAPWFGQTEVSEDGVAAAQSGVLGGGQQSWLQTTTNMPQSSEISFWWKVSSQPPDALSFSIDGVVIASISGTVVGWQHVETNLPPGDITLTWTYTKESYDAPTGMPFADSGWVDEVNVGRLPFFPLQPINQAGTPGGTVTFNAAVAGTLPISLQWFLNGAILAGMTNESLHIADAQGTNVGNYSLVASNFYGNTTSAVVSLALLSPNSNCTNPPSGLVGWWPADGNTLDIVGGNNGTLTNGATFAAGLVGEAFSFTTANEGVVIPYTPSQDLSQMPAWTIDAWINPVSFNNQTYPTIYAQGVFNVSLGLNSQTGALESWIDNQNQLIGTISVPVGRWSHVDLVYDGTNRTFFINGNPAGSGTAPVITPEPSVASIGIVEGYSYSSFDGLIDELSIFNRALSSTEIQSIYNAASAGMCRPDPVISNVSPMSGIPGNLIMIEGTDLPFVAAVQFNGVSAQFLVQSNGQINVYVPTNATTGPIALLTDSGGVVQTSNNFSITTAPQCVPAPSGLVDWWTGDGNAFDIAGGDNGIPQNGATYEPGIVGQAFSFDGLSQYMYVPETGLTSVTNNFTMEFWVNPGASLAVTPETNSGTSGTCCQRYVIFPSQSPNDSAGAGVSVGINGISVFELADFYMPSLLVYQAPILGWTHVAVVYQNKQPTLYVNGQCVRTGQTSSRSSVYPSAEFGGNPSGYGYFAGLLDQVAVFNRALSATEVQAIFNAAGAGMCKLEPGISSVGSLSGIAGNLVTIEGTNFFDVAGVLFNGVSAQFIAQSNSQIIAYVPNGAATGPISLLTVAGNAITTSNIFTVAPTVKSTANPVLPPSGLVDWWPGDGNALDIVGGDNGFPQNGVGYGTGVVGQAFSFNGVNQWIYTPTRGLTNVTNNFTMEFWANPTASLIITPETNSGASGTGGQRYVLFPDQSSDASAGAGISVGSNGISVFELAGSYMPSLLVYQAPILGWTHVAVVYQNEQPSLYVNGQWVRTGQTSLRSFVYPSTDLGGDPSGYGYFAGLLDEVAIFNRPLSPAEVLAIYNAGSAGMSKQPIFDTSLTGLHWTSNGLSLRLNGPLDQGPLIISASTNLTSWFPVFTNMPTNGPLQFIDTTATNSPYRFYRAVEQ